MSDGLERFAAELDECGCCDGLSASSPIRIHNRPGQDAVAYRIGTHATFRESLLAALSSSRHPILADLKTRDDGDFSIALLDAFSCMADVLTFYQERFANEAWLRTAEERLSLGELARLIGYRLAPGVAADALLAFTLEEAPGAPADAVGQTRIAVGTRVQSTPGPDEDPQIYETVEEIQGRVAWNAIRPPLSQRHPLTGSTNPLYVAGAATGLRPGDGVLVEKGGGGLAFAVATAVDPAPELELTRVAVTWLAIAPERGSASFQLNDPVLEAPAADYLNEVWSAADLQAEAATEDFDSDALLRVFSENPRPAPRVLVFRARAAIFGHNAPTWSALPLPLKVQEKKYEVATSGNVTLVATIPAPFSETDWIDGKSLAALDGTGSGVVRLDTTYPTMGQSSPVVLRQGDRWAVYRAEGVDEESHAAFNLSAKVTRLELDGTDKLDRFEARKTTVFGGAEVLALARPPIPTDFAADPEGWLELHGWVPGLKAGQTVIISGRASGGGEEAVSDAGVVERVEYRLAFEGGTRIKVSPRPTHTYQRPHVFISANVVAATHGESVDEILGSGDARMPFQSFVLTQPPLTFVSAATDGGRKSTLEIRVNDVLWHEVDTFHGRGREERVFVTRQTDDGKTVVRFGNGDTGARLPTGINNVRALYRKGIGIEGRVAPRKLNVLMSRPLGLKGVVNPLSAEGGEAPESREQARENAPLTVLTLGRAVSLQDYEDMARTFAGISRALATWSWAGGRRSVFLTVAGSDGHEVPQGGFIHSALLGALSKAGDPNVPLTVASYRKALFRLDATVFVHPDHLADVVLEAVESTLRETFSFERRGFGQPVPLSGVVAAIQGVEGVRAVVVNKLHRTDQAVGLNAVLPAQRPRAGVRGTVDSAEILFLDPAPLEDVRTAP